MTNSPYSNSSNAWFAIDRDGDKDSHLALYTLQLKGDRALSQAVVNKDWVVVLDTKGHITRVGRILRIRSDLETATLYFDRILQVVSPVSVGSISLTLPAKGSSGRLRWKEFIEMLPNTNNRRSNLHPRITAISSYG